MSLSTTTNTSGRTPEQDAVICALIGLARAAEAKEIPAGTAPVLFAALSSVTPGNPLSASASRDLVEQIHKQKAIIAPDCAACPSPCGRTTATSRIVTGCLQNSASTRKRNGSAFSRSRKIWRSHDSLWTACSWPDMPTKRSCLRRILKNWRH